MSEYITKVVETIYDSGKTFLQDKGVIAKPIVTNTNNNTVNNQDVIRKFIHEHPVITSSIVLSLLSSLTKYGLRQLKKRVLPNTVLEIDLEDLQFTSQPVMKTGFEALMGQTKTQMHYLTFIETLRIANKNPNIVGIVLHFQGTSHNPFAGLGLAHLQEMRKSLEQFNGLKIAHAVSMEAGPLLYYFASACDRVYIADQGILMLNGFQLRSFFVKELLEKLEVEFFGVKRAEYKTALNMFTEKKFDEYHKEQVETLGKELLDVIVNEIATSRNTNVENIREWLDIGLFNAKEAVEHNIIDQVLYRDEVVDKIAELLSIESKKLKFLYIQKYLEQKLEDDTLKLINTSKQTKDNTVAVIFASGAITRGRNARPNDTTTIYSHVIADAIKKARKDKNVKAIILRVDSPGGEVSASEMIRREVELAKKDGKKIIVSMASVAASGGYWISTDADRILCNSLTITGSIGVLTGKMYLGDLFAKKLGITNDCYQTNKNAGLFSTFDRVNEDQTEVFNTMADDFYNAFIERVSKTRNISEEDLKNKIAKGKVYLGKSALENKLVDKIGGYYDAVQEAKELCEMKTDPYIVIVYPRRKTLIEALLQRDTASNSEERSQRTQTSTIFSSFTSFFSGMSMFYRFCTLFMKHGERYVSLFEKITTNANEGVVVRSEIDSAMIEL
ncbi:hypothetical protein ABK040_016547 [Willaertia magna]